MVIVNGSQSFYLQDIPVIRFKDVSEIGYANISFLGGSTEEVYTPNASDDVYIHCLPQFCSDYLQIDVLPSVAGGHRVFDNYINKLHIDFKDGDDNEAELDADIYPLRDIAGYAPCVQFLTRSKVKHISSDEIFTVSHIGGGNYFIVTSYSSAGITEGDEELLVTTSDQLVSYTFKKSDFADGVYMLKICLYDNQDNLVDAMYVHFEDDHRFSRTFVFDNAFYAPEAFTFHGTVKDNMSYESEVGYIASKLKRLTNNSHGEYVITSGMLSESQYRTVLDMVDADNVYMIEDGYAVPVVITNFETDHKDPKDAPCSVTMTYRLSERPRVKLFSEQEPSGIFNSNFNKVFD